MGIESRDYYRKANTSGWRAEWGLYGLTPVVKWVIIINVVVWIAQTLLTYPVRYSPLEFLRKYNPAIDRFVKEHGDSPEAIEALKKKYPYLEQQFDEDFDEFSEFWTERVSYVQHWCELDSKKVIGKGQLWRIVTCAFCHDRMGYWHILFNMLFLYWFGCTIEAMYGHREFLVFYLTSAAIASLAYIGMDVWTGEARPALGASGAVMAVTMLYAMHFPRETIRLFWLIPIQMRWLMIAYVVWEVHPVLLQLSSERVLTGIAHAAHLGGLAFGFLYWRLEWRLSSLFDRFPSFAGKRIQRPCLRVVQPPEMERVPDPDAERIDEILEKIYNSGKDSLTDEERELLHRASERLRSKRG